jgi:hypothetical protein
MKKYYFLLFLISIIASCNNEKTRVSSEKTLKDEVMEVAVKFAGSKFNQAKQTVEKNGIIVIQENRENFVALSGDGFKYIIDPANIIIGLIDDDNDPDAIISISPVKDQYFEIPEILIMTRTEGNYIINRVIESDMKILQLKGRVITAEITTKSRNSPLRDCMKCKEIVKYRFSNGDLIKTEEK